MAIQPVQPVAVERHRPREQEGGFEVEHDEQDGDQVEADVELAAAVLERREAAFIFAELCRVRAGACRSAALTSIGSTTNAADSASAMMRKSRIGR